MISDSALREVEEFAKTLDLSVLVGGSGTVYFKSKERTIWHIDEDDGTPEQQFKDMMHLMAGYRAGLRSARVTFMRAVSDLLGLD